MCLVKSLKKIIFWRGCCLNCGHLFKQARINIHIQCLKCCCIRMRLWMWNEKAYNFQSKIKLLRRFGEIVKLLKLWNLVKIVSHHVGRHVHLNAGHHTSHHIGQYCYTFPFLLLLSPLLWAKWWCCRTPCCRPRCIQAPPSP